jgi:hypothetical protein
LARAACSLCSVRSARGCASAVGVRVIDAELTAH